MELTGPNGLLSYGFLGASMGVMILALGLVKWVVQKSTDAVIANAAASQRVADELAQIRERLGISRTGGA